MEEIRIARSDEEVSSCFHVMRQLRTHLHEPDFVGTVRRQFEGGYKLAFLEEGGAVRAVAGYRFMDNLASGRILYVDDLSTDAGVRSRGYGARLFDWLLDQARSQGCSTIELDSGVQRHDAHRFYFVKRMFIASHHFRRTL